MAELPTGTVSLLFSDIEGSTLLLSRLGHSYADALDGQRHVLRKAWSAHGGTELGTEGDSFFVVFPTAEGAVRAAAQAQRELDGYPWPEGEHVRVRIGIHTGSPRVHDGGYVGMDVHRAARIAGSAHGGQVVMSSVTADLARGGLPEGVGVRDLGTHRLKDIAAPERLFQLVIDGLPADFPALRTVGATSSLPVPATALVGRDGEVAELTALLRSPGGRLVTLMGPGGSGKTRLAIAVAERLVAAFPDGVFFVPLAAVSSADVMWTSIAEVLDVPPKRRTPPGLLDELARRSALLVLDNLEQLPDADEVVAQLLSAAPHLAVVATSRRALSVPGEHRYALPPLTLPADATLAHAEESGAVQLFVQHACRIRPEFRLTDENVADVVALCRHLDGLPLAIELSATRIRLLSPRALLRRIEGRVDGRIDGVLDIASTTRQRPSRQWTLRDTIAWSYDLLTPGQQAFFRRLGVVAGGADLDGVTAVTAGPDGSPEAVRDVTDPLERVADLVDGSLATIAEGPDGEPRVAMLETIRAYARDALDAAGEAAVVRSAHARHYLEVAERLRARRESQHLVALGVAEIELDNFREALGWALERDVGERTGSDEESIGLRLCSALGWLWYTGGYAVEGLHWFEQLIERAGPTPSRHLAACLGGMANLLIHQGEPERARDAAVRGLTMARTLGDEEQIASALGVLGTAHQMVGDVDAARATLEEALQLHRRRGSSGMLARTLGNLAGVEETLGHYDRAEELTRESLGILEALGDMHEAAIQGQNLANLLAMSGRAEEADRIAHGLIDTILKLRSPTLTMAFANTYMNILLRRDAPVPAAHLFGAEEGMRERLAMPNPYQQEELEEAWALVRDRMPVEEWERHRRLGQSESVEDLLAQLRTG